MRKVLVDVGPLAIVSAHDENGNDRPGLYLIWVKGHEAKVGPYFANVSKAHEGAKKIVKRFPAEIWKQPVGWLVRQKEMLSWIEKEIGAGEDLVGGYWVDENGKIILRKGQS
jgi:hypothetical protein